MSLVLNTTLTTTVFNYHILPHLEAHAPISEIMLSSTTILPHLEAHAPISEIMLSYEEDKSIKIRLHVPRSEEL